MRKLTLEDVQDILVGCTILGTGGGGSLEKGLKLVEEDFRQGLEYNLVSLEEIPEEALCACPYFCGSIGPEQREDRYYSYPRVAELETVTAVRALERFLGRNLEAVVSVEYGGMNTAVAMSTGARLHKCIVDADGAGRAVPDLQFSTYYVYQRPIYPLAVANAIGDVAVFEKVADDFRAEDLVRALAVVSGGMVGMVDHPCTGKELRGAVIPAALSYAGKVGRARRLALEQGRDPVQEILAAGEGYLLFQGVVKKDTQWENTAGFTIGTIEFTGSGDYQNSEFKVWFKNENAICWENGQVAATVPDLICVVETKSGYPITNPFCKAGMEMTVLGFQAPQVWRSPGGLSILNPQFFGFPVEYVPIEEKMQKGRR